MNDLFWAKVLVGDGCWEWTGWRKKTGYGVYQSRGKKYAAHRVAYKELVGEIPEGLELDHLCRNPPCVNPAHLEAVTRSENMRRSKNTQWAQNAKKTHCKRGHPLNGENLYVKPNGQRNCRECNRVRGRDWIRRKRVGR